MIKIKHSEGIKLDSERFIDAWRWLYRHGFSIRIGGHIFSVTW